MGKKKDATALFEVVSRSRDGGGGEDPRVPQWVSRHMQAAEGRPPGGDAPPQPIAPQPAPQPEAVVATGEGRLRLSLNYASCVTAVVGLVLVVGAAFWLGRGTAPGAAHTAGMGPAGGPKPAGAFDPNAQRCVWIIKALPGATAADRRAAQDVVANLEQLDPPRPLRIGTLGERCVIYLDRPFVCDRAARQYAKAIEPLGYGPPTLGRLNAPAGG
jgi:hypothetical protein